MGRKDKEKYLLAFILVILGILSRTVFHIGDNVEFVTSATLLSAAYLGKKYALVVPFFIMAVTDVLIGNTNIFMFTWSGYIVIGLMGILKLNFKSKAAGERNLVFKLLTAGGVGIAASFWFYLWTNFGVWFLDNWGMYPRTLSGLVDAYILGLPFFKYNLIGNVVLVPISFFTAETIKTFLSSLNFSGIKLNHKAREN
ncbi:hypothetical protein M1271_01500 [Patescibacteria group bacterium]|nr:hypothetical protein [Patescibacteria group bacterium]MCL5798095.1 hypothetical protein [Patescibacteria group bacterium]